ncbi:5' nucleotidase, NT5C type [Neobacillus cucumis]|uniref:5' nucleotidase, NT5C type n=1 Tax=Neobacillus cucumis TaxID=1740721 RepID=UPI00196323D6|nr:hypothetical protein [Neobacillus cucumis]MBM7654531.1 5'(3')-deoxyribonucleotidase [Neobacillus cucumis]
MKMLNESFLRQQNEVFDTDYMATIAFDLDDVCNLFNQRYAEILNDAFGLSLTMEDITEWDLTKIVPPHIGPKVYDFFKRPGLFRYIEPAPYVAEVMQRLTDRGFDIIIISDPPSGHAHSDNMAGDEPYLPPGEYQRSNPCDDKRAWVAEHLPMIPQSNLFFGKQKYRIRFDLLIDDKPETFELMQNFGLPILLMDKPYNRHILTDKRITNLLEAEEKIYELFLYATVGSY